MHICTNANTHTHVHMQRLLQALGGTSSDGTLWLALAVVTGSGIIKVCVFVPLQNLNVEALTPDEITQEVQPLGGN